MEGWIQGVTIAAAAVGAVLGVVNTVWSLWRDRVRIRVVPVWEISRGPNPDGRIALVQTEFESGLDKNPDGLFGIRVTNLGFVDVIITGVGFTPSGWLDRRRRSKLVKTVINFDARGEIKLPKRLGSRESFIVWCPAVGDELDDKLRKTERVFAATDCGLVKFSTSGLLRDLIREARAFRAGDR